MALAAPAHAQSAAGGATQVYPAKPIRIIIPFPIGGIADVFARILGGKFNEAWGQPVVVENRAGAGGNIAAEYVAKSPPDGYTLVVGSIGTHAVNVSLFKKIPFDPVRDFAPISMMLEAEGLLVLHPSLPAKNIKELIALAKARPGQIVYASAGNGTAGHLSGELLKSMAKIDLVHVPYKGNVPAITDLIGGQTSLLFATMPTVLPHVKSGRLNAIAVTGAKRSPAAPELPAIAETLPGYDVTNWVGAFAPAGTPRDVVTKAARGDRARDAVAGNSKAPAHRRCPLHADVAGTVRWVRQSGNCQVGKGDPRSRHPRGLSAT